MLNQRSVAFDRRLSISGENRMQSWKITKLPQTQRPQAS